MAGSVNAGSIVYEVDMDTARLLAARREVDAALNGLGGNMGRLEASVNRTERSISAMNSTMSSLSGLAKGIAAALSIQQVTQYGNEWVTVNNKLANSVRANESLAEVTQRVFDISQNTMSSLGATATLYGRLERATRSAGTSTEDLITLTSTINKGLAVSGATTEEASSTMTQLSQALASGVLRGEEFNSISENGSRLAVALADSLGVTIGQLRAMAAQGKLTTEVVVKGLLQQSDAIAKEFGKTVTTMGQAITIATNNITKFVGESSSVSTSIHVFNNGVISLSNNLEVVANLIGATAVIMGSRFVGALFASTTARVNEMHAAQTQAKASLESAKSSSAEAATKLRAAEANKSLAISNLDGAQTERSLLIATNGTASAEVARADAALASIRVNMQQIAAEKALEQQRLRAQISETGRIATSTRMAQLQQASSVLSRQLAAAEATAATSRGNAMAAADAKVSAARAELATVSGAAATANRVYQASLSAVSAAATAASGTITRLVTGAFGLIGGTSGVVVIAAAALYYFYQKAQQARQESIAFADTLTGVVSKMKEMSSVQLAAQIDKASQSIVAQRDALKDTSSTIQANEVQQERLRATLSKLTEGSALYKYTLSELSQAQSEHTQLLAESERQENKLSQTISQTGMLRAQASGQFKQGIDLLSRDGQAAGVTAGLMTQLGHAINFASGAKEKFNSSSIAVERDAKSQGVLDNLYEQNELLSEGNKRRRAQLKVEQELRATGADDNTIRIAREQVGAIYDKQQAESAAKKEASAAARAETQAEAAEKRRTKSLEELNNEMAVAELNNKNLHREATKLAAVQDLGAGASQAQISVAQDQAGEIFDIQQRMRDKKDALEQDQVAKVTRQRDLDLSQLERQVAAGDVSFEKSQKRRADLAATYSEQIAQANAKSAVTPQQRAAGNVDPVQALANENAQKLELIQEFEQQRIITEQQGLALRNAANAEYEQQRIAAQWEIYRSQSEANNLLATAVDSLQGGASSAITGLLNGTQSLSEAFANIGTTILNSVVSSLVDLGLQYAKNMIMGQVAATAALASTTAQAAAAAAAWAPAAISASIATMGAASATGTTAYSTALVASKGLAIAGAREHGGPVNGHSMYRVGEGGKPEIYKASNGNQYMIPGDNGRVISNSDIGRTDGGASFNPTMNLTINTTGGIDDGMVKQLRQAWSTDMMMIMRDQQRPGGMLRKK